MQEELCKTKNTERNKIQTNLIKYNLEKFKNDIKKMSKDKTEIEKPSKIINAVAKILEFNEQNKEGRGLKILTPEQMLSRLPISLAQLKAGYNSEKLKNEIRQLLYSLYRSKKLSKTIYKHLINAT